MFSRLSFVLLLCVLAGAAAGTPRSTAEATTTDGTFVLAGVSDQPATVSLPSGASTGVLRSCRPQLIYMFVTVTDLSTPKEVEAVWMINGSEGSEPIPPIHFPEGSYTATFTFLWEGELLPQGMRFGLRLRSGAGVPELDSELTLSCGGG